MSKRIRLLAWMLALPALGLLPVRGADAVPSLPTIIQGAIARDDATQKALRSLQYHQVLNTEQLDANGKVTKKQEIQMIVRPGADNEIQVVAEKGDDLPGNPDEASLQAQGKKAQKQKLNFPLKDLVSRFNVTLIGTGTFQNQPVYILGFEPKPGQPYRNQTEKVLNHLHGRLWISARDYSILQTNATLADPVEVAWIFAKVSFLSFHYELNNTTGGFAPAQISTSVIVSTPFVEIRQTMKVVMTQVEPRTDPRRLVDNGSGNS
jgi:hypothetical protein